MIDDQAWCQSAGTHYRELAAWLREIGGKCRLPNPQRELLRLARRYELRADQLDRRSRQGQSSVATAARRWIIALSLAWLSSSAIAADLSGSARVIDGDTIVIGDTHIRLWGIDAPERQQTCRSKTGSVYECGRDSAAVLRELTRDRAIQCRARDRDQYGRVVAVCRTESAELNAAMVRRGWAVDFTKYSRGRYRPEEEQARREQLGIWAGRFEMPSEWRHRH
jgi:endonuclease YncB( thermonuclease family)